MLTDLVSHSSSFHWSLMFTPKIQTERSTIRVYELTLSPGAPGGSGYGMGVS